MVDLAVVFSLAAVILIAAEWTYVILWTRRFAKTVVGSILRSVNNLRIGRGKIPTVPEQLLELAKQPPAQLDMDNIDLNHPLAKQFIERIASKFGVDEALVREYAEQVVGPEKELNVPGLPPEPGSPPRAPSPPPPSGGQVFGALLQGVLSGQIPIDQALAAAAPVVIPHLMRGLGEGNQAGAPSSGEWWG